MTELRCDHAMHAIITDEGDIEVVCRSRYCGSRSGVVVLHRFSSQSGKLLSTRKYRNPKREGGELNGSSDLRTAVRIA